MTPRADFTCLSPKCRQDGAATVYEDLPIASKRCPVCGSKRITRLYNKIAVVRGAAPERDSRLTSSSHLNRSTALLQSGFDHYDATKPGYTPPPGGGSDPHRYDKLKTFEARAEDIPGLILPGKATPMTEMEIARDRRATPKGAVDTLASLSGRTIPTVPLREKPG